jgi:TPR repeat protein
MFDHSTELNCKECSTTSSKTDHDSCAVCLDTMTLAASLELLPCGHRFHSACVEKIRSSTTLSQCCPLCRSSLPPASLASLPIDVEDCYQQANDLFYELQDAGLNLYSPRPCTMQEEKCIKYMVQCWHGAACMGNEGAMFNLALLYRVGFGVPQSDQEASYWYLKSALLGHVGSQSNIGYLYHYGIGIEKNIVEAIKWYTLAAVEEYPDALYNLGSMYEKGEGVGQDLFEAVWLYNKAKEYEHFNAKKALHRLGLTES